MRRNPTTAQLQTSVRGHSAQKNSLPLSVFILTFSIINEFQELLEVVMFTPHSGCLTLKVIWFNSIDLLYPLSLWGHLCVVAAVVHKLLSIHLTSCETVSWFDDRDVLQRVGGYKSVNTIT